MRRWRRRVLVGASLILAIALFGVGPALAGDNSADAATNRNWLLLCGFLVFFMQAGFALMETGLTRAKNVAHTMAMNILVYALATAGFWACGFALMFGNYGSLDYLAPGEALNAEWSLWIGGKEFGLFGARGFFLAGMSSQAGVLALFMFQLMFLDTAATIPTGALAERWKLSAFVAYSLVMSMVIYPVYGNWVWGNGWLSQLGAHWGLGHGHVDFAGSTVVHMTGGVGALVGAWMVGPRIGKFRADGFPNPLPAHNVPMYMLGTLILAFGWFGFNAGSVRSATDPNTARIAVNTILSSAAAALASVSYTWFRFGKPDPSFLCNGMLAGLVAITASCAYVQVWAAVVIGAAAGILVIASCFFVERILRVDDPVGAVSVHGTVGVWGAIALGLFADGTYAPYERFNGVSGNLTGLFYGGPGQLAAECIGVAANLIWVVPTTFATFWMVRRLIGNRVPASVEMQGLDVHELGTLGYITQDAKAPEARVFIPQMGEPRPALAPPETERRYAVTIEGVEVTLLMNLWSDLCQARADGPSPEFRAVYPHVTTVQGNRFRFRGGDPQVIRSQLERLFQQALNGSPVRTRLEL
jgi:Amt family ammonium transporter